LGWVGLGWVGLGPPVYGLGWVGSGSLWAGLDWVTCNGPMDNTGVYIAYCK